MVRSVIVSLSAFLGGVWKADDVDDENPGAGVKPENAGAPDAGVEAGKADAPVAEVKAGKADAPDAGVGKASGTGASYCVICHTPGLVGSASFRGAGFQYLAAAAEAGAGCWLPSTGC